MTAIFRFKHNKKALKKEAITITLPPQNVSTNVVDVMLTLADSNLKDESGLSRSEATRSFLQIIGVPTSSRLMYRSQPIAPDEVKNPLWTLHRTYYEPDDSFYWLNIGAKTVLHGNNDQDLIKCFGGTENSPNFLTLLDAYNAIPLELHTPVILSRVNCVRALLHGIESNMEAILASFAPDESNADAITTLRRPSRSSGEAIMDMHVSEDLWSTIHLCWIFQLLLSSFVLPTSHGRHYAKGV
jgi:hypothetical protein